MKQRNSQSLCLFKDLFKEEIEERAKKLLEEEKNVKPEDVIYKPNHTDDFVHTKPRKYYYDPQFYNIVQRRWPERTYYAKPDSKNEYLFCEDLSNYIQSYERKFVIVNKIIIMFVNINEDTRVIIDYDTFNMRTKLTQKQYEFHIPIQKPTTLASNIPICLKCDKPLHFRLKLCVDDLRKIYTHDYSSSNTETFTIPSTKIVKLQSQLKIETKHFSLNTHRLFVHPKQYKAQFIESINLTQPDCPHDFISLTEDTETQLSDNITQIIDEPKFQTPLLKQQTPITTIEPCSNEYVRNFRKQLKRSKKRKNRIKSKVQMEHVNTIVVSNGWEEPHIPLHTCMIKDPMILRDEIAKAGYVYSKKYAAFIRIDSMNEKPEPMIVNYCQFVTHGTFVVPETIENLLVRAKLIKDLFFQYLSMAAFSIYAEDPTQCVRNKLRGLLKFFFNPRVIYQVRKYIPFLPFNELVQICSYACRNIEPIITICIQMLTDYKKNQHITQKYDSDIFNKLDWYYGPYFMPAIFDDHSIDEDICIKILPTVSTTMFNSIMRYRDYFFDRLDPLKMNLNPNRDLASLYNNWIIAISRETIDTLYLIKDWIFPRTKFLKVAPEIIIEFALFIKKYMKEVNDYIVVMPKLYDYYTQLQFKHGLVDYKINLIADFYLHDTPQECSAYPPGENEVED